MPVEEDLYLRYSRLLLLRLHLIFFMLLAVVVQLVVGGYETISLFNISCAITVIVSLNILLSGIYGFL